MSIGADIHPCTHPRWVRLCVPTFAGSLTGRVACSVCGQQAVGKPLSYVAVAIRPLVANEIIASRLLDYLRQAGLAVDAPSYIPGLFYDPERSPTCWQIAVCNDVGAHARVSVTRDPPGAIWPSWLYDFNRWIGRLDGQGETNLLLLADRPVIVPVDWSLSFVWAASGPRNLIRAVFDLEVPHHPQEKNFRRLETIEVIRAITDEMIWEACSQNMTEDLIPPALITAYWSGLCLRRNLLQKDD